MLSDFRIEKRLCHESLYAHNWRKAGVSSVQLVEKLVQLAEDRYAKRQKFNTAFSTNYLKQF